MSINIGHLFVRTEDRSRVADAAAEFLKGFAPALRDPDPATRKLLDGEGKRSLFVSPAVRGWTLVLEGAHRTADAALARALSDRLRTRVVRLLVNGCVFDHHWNEWDHGRPGGESRLLTADDEAALVLPAFQDAERLAWDKALRLGLPPELLFVRGHEFPQAPANTPSNAILLELTCQGSEVRLGGFRTAVTLPDERLAPRVLFDAVLTDGESGRAELAIEQRFLWGRPEPAAVERLATMLRSLRHRYARATGFAEEKIRFAIRAGEMAAMPVQMPEDLQAPPHTL